MIEVTRKETEITVKGHAGYAENVKDIVCVLKFLYRFKFLDNNVWAPGVYGWEVV